MWLGLRHHNNDMQRIEYELITSTCISDVYVGSREWAIFASS